MAKQTKKHMTEEEKKDWTALYEYVRTNVMGYDENQSLSKQMVLRLKGLLTNKFIENNNISDSANYSYSLVLTTFKFCFPDIQRGLRSNSFRDEFHKFNYVLKIVESNLNTVYVRLKNAERKKEEIENMKFDMLFHEGATYQRKTKDSSQKFDEDLW